MATNGRTPAPQPATPTGIRVVIVGAGFGGLTAAIECWRQGHTPIVLEKTPEIKPLGDIISFAANSSRIFKRWPGVAEQLDPISLRPDGMTINSFKGETLYHQRWSDEENSWGDRYDGHRGEYHQIIYHHAIDYCGIEVRLGARVVDYFEDENSAGVELEGGERVVGDVVVAAEGARSRGRTTVLGYEDLPKPSGYAVFRSWFQVEDTPLATDPELRWLFEGEDKHIVWLAPDVHFIAAVLKGGKDISWVCTHRDDRDIGESWQWPASIDDAKPVVAGWESTVQRILDATPENRIVDWKLVFRDPLPRWVSPKKRVCLIGDAAHPFIPTSIQGASQSMEDGATLAVCLRRCLKAGAKTADIPEAVEAFEALRYERVRSAQRTGVQTREIWHKADFEAARRDPASLRLRREGWLLNFDAEAFAEEEYGRTVAVLHEKGMDAARALHVPEGKLGFVEYN